MKKHLIAAAALATLSTAVLAQSSVTVYGIIDTAVFSTNNSGSDGQRQTSMQSGTWMPSLFGFAGSEDLGGGLKANFDLQADLSSTTGAGGMTASSSGNTVALFNRNATVGLSGSFGKIDLGKQLDNFFLQGVANSIVFMHANTLAYHGLAYSRSNGNSGTAGVFNNNMVAYETPTFNGFKAKFQYTITGGASDSASKAMRNAIATYSNAGLSLSAGYEVVTKADGLTAGTQTANDNKKSLVGAKYKIGQVDLAAQYQTYKQDGATNAGGLDIKGYELGVGYNVSPALLVAVNYERFKNELADTTPTIVSLKAKYALSKRTALYGFVANHDKDASGLGQGYSAVASASSTKTTTNYAVGVTHSF
jgi:predicted porin